MTTLGQISYERRNRRNEEAPPWELLAPCQQSKEERAACAVADAVVPTLETMRAEIATLRSLLSICTQQLNVAHAEIREYERLAKGLVIPNAEERIRIHARAELGVPA